MGSNLLNKIKGNYNDKDKMAYLYGYWQTKSFQNKLNPDGSIPENDHGNIEIFRDSDVPEGTQWLKIKRGRFICKKLGIDYKEAMTGFESGAHGMSYPVIDGVIVHDKDVDKVIQTSDRMEKERIAREIKRKQNEAKNTWKLLIKKVCVKRYTSRLFDRDIEDRAMDIPLSFKKQ